MSSGRYVNPRLPGVANQSSVGVYTASSIFVSDSVGVASVTVCNCDVTVFGETQLYALVVHKQPFCLASYGMQVVASQFNRYQSL